MAQAIFGRVDQIAADGESISQDSVNTIELQMREALSAMTTGKGDIAHASCLAGEVSKAMVLCESDHAGSKQYLHLAIAAREALANAGERAQRVGRWALSGPDLRALYDFVELRVALLNESTKGIERAAHDTVMGEIKRGNVVRFTHVREEVAA